MPNNMDTFRRCEGFRYIIKEGDTLYKISRAQNVPLDEIIRENMGINIYNLIPGQSICIPYPRNNMPRPDMPPVRPRPNIGNLSNLIAYIIKDEDTIEDILERLGIDFDELVELNKPNGLPLKPGVSINVPRNNQ